MLERFCRLDVSIFFADGWKAYAELIPQGVTRPDESGNARD
jgi:IS1 family transposase